MRKEYLEAGKIVGTHGLRGDLRVESWCDSPEFLCGFDTLYWNNGNSSMKVISSKVHKNIVLMKLDGIDTIEKADELRGKILYINRKDVKMDENCYFIQDIIGMEVYDIDSNKMYGKVTEVFKTGANDVYQVTDENGKDYLVPVIPSVIIETDIDENRMLIRPIRGIFEDED